ncbi:MAG: isopentenyl phosphate kinase family protein [archaeon]|nr:isopentenyl phosphate kinase family protein [archaeon]
MSKIDDIVIMKIGGSVITDKNKPLSIRKNIIDQIIDEIIKFGKKLIIIHGGGSYGHPLAKKYSIMDGINSEIEEQYLGLAETHNAMVKLNSILIDKFLEKKRSAISLQTSSLFIDGEKMSFFGTEHIERLLQLKIIPVLYGDIVLHREKGFSIISGDKIIPILCNSIKKFRVSKVLFCIDQDGLIGNNGLINEISCSDLEKIELSKFKEKIDVTGGIKGKLDEIIQIVKTGIEVQLINGTKKDYILNALNNLKIPSTNIIMDNI